nr:hypothetical protein [uncultured Agathobaculum sp.]
MKPILFNTGMTRAILEGRKTVTRRVMKPQPVGNSLIKMPDHSCYPGYWAEVGSERVIKPLYQPGDVLWVRETWTRSMAGTFMYRADETAIVCDRWRPSIHMPREAARIFLRVTSVRCERLQEITEEGAKAEGICGFFLGMGETGYSATPDAKSFYDGPVGAFANLWDSTMPKHLYKFKRYPFYWEDNPWVWVIEFERIGNEGKKNEDVLF